MPSPPSHHRSVSFAFIAVLSLLVVGAPVRPAEATGTSAMEMELRLATCFDEGISVASTPLSRSVRRCILDVRTTRAIAGGFDVALGFLWTDNGPDGVTAGFSDPVVTCPASAGALCEYTTIDIQASPITWSPDTQTFSVFATRLCGGAPCDPVDEIRLDSQAIFLRHATMSIHCSPWPVPVNVPFSCAARVEDAGGAGIPSRPTTPGQVGWTQIVPTQNGFRQPSFHTDYCNLIAQVEPYRAECDLHHGALWASFQMVPYQVTASWPGDADHGPASAFQEVDPVDRQASLEFACATVYVGEPVPCDVTVTDTDIGEAHEIRGNVSVRSPTAFSGLHTFYDHACELVRPPPGVPATCSFTLYPWAAGPIALEGRFEAQTPHIRATVASTAHVLHRPVLTAVGCGPGTLAVGAAGVCTVSVQDATGYRTPSGFVQLSGAGIDWAPSSCLLVPTGADARATCTVGFAPASGAAWPSDSEIVLDAVYAGDGLHSGGDSSSLVKVHRRATTTSVVCTPDVLIPIEGPTPAATCDGAVADAAPPSPFALGGTLAWSTAETCAAPTLACSVSWVPTSVGFDWRYANYSGAIDHLPSGASDSVRVHAETRVAYAGALSVVTGAPLATRATAASAIAGCAASRAGAVSYTLDRDPFTALPAPVVVATSDLDASGATSLDISTSGWVPGTYRLATRLAGTDACDESVDVAFLVVGAPGQVASGAGSTGSSTSATTASSASTSTSATGASGRSEQLTFSAQKRGGTYNGTLVISTEAWRLRGTVATLTKTSANGVTRCAADGLAELQIAVLDLSTGRTTWVHAARGTAVPFSLYLEDHGSEGGDAYGLHLGRIPLPSDPPLPSSGAVAQMLGNGDVGCR